jgi:hypothetical protein
MPQILVTADQPSEAEAPAIMFRERVSSDDLESDHFAAQLVQRLQWAVGDAEEVNRRSATGAERRRVARRRMDAVQRELSTRQRPPRSASVVTTAS